MSPSHTSWHLVQLLGRLPTACSPSTAPAEREDGVNPSTDMITLITRVTGRRLLVYLMPSARFHSHSHCCCCCCCSASITASFNCSDCITATYMERRRGAGTFFHYQNCQQQSSRSHVKQLTYDTTRPQNVRKWCIAHAQPVSPCAMDSSSLGA